MNFSFKSLFAIWSLSPHRFHYYFFLSIVSWQHQKYSTILILMLRLLCVTQLVCSFFWSFAPSSPFFSSWWQKTYTCPPMFSIDVVASAPDDPSLQNVFQIRNHVTQVPPAGLNFFGGKIFVHTLGVYVQFFKIRAKTRKSPKSPKSQIFATHSNVLFHSKVTSVFADSSIVLLCRALCTCVAHAPTESCSFSLLVHWISSLF